MNRGDFIALLQNPAQATPAQLQELERVAVAFPYCQTAHLLIAKVAHDQKTMLADQKLKLAAAYAIDRSQLKELVYHDMPEVTPSVLTVEPENTPVSVNITESVEVVVTPPVVQIPVAETPVAPEPTAVKEEEPEPVQAKDPGIAEMISHREKLMQELELKLQEIKRNRERFQQHTQAPVSPVENIRTEQVEQAEAPAETPMASATPEPVAEIIAATAPVIPIEAIPPVIEITPIHPIESILSAVEDKNKPVLPAGHDELPDAVKAIYESVSETPKESGGIHVLDEILRMDEKQQLMDEDLSIFKRPKKTAEPEAEIPTPLPTENPARQIPAEHPVTREQSLVPLNILGKLEGYIASDNDTENNSVDQGQADMLSDYLDFINNKRLKNRRDPRKVDAIIDRFIKDEPIISRLAPDQVKDEQEDLAEKSYTPPAGLISENFARILVSQGKKDRAIKVYEELILKNPEKKDYFALLIEQIRKGE